MNETLKTIKSRRSVRKYKDEQLSEEHLMAIIEAGRYAPSGGNSQSCSILAIQNPKILGDLTALAQQEFAKMDVKPDTYKSLATSITLSQKGNYNFSYNAPTLIIITNIAEYGNAMADSACMLENMMLAAHSIGVGSCWLNQLRWLNENDAARKYLYGLGMEENHSVFGSLGLGYPNAPILPQLERKGNKFKIIK